MFASSQSDSDGTLILGHEDIARLVSGVGCDRVMDEMIDRLESAFRQFRDEEWELPPRDGFHYRGSEFGLLEWMPVMRRGERILLKLVGYHPENPTRRNLSTIQSLLAVFSTRTGAAEAVLDGELLTAVRTGAASAIATRLLAPLKSDVLGVIGAGAQSITQTHGISRVLPLREILVHDICPKTEATFAGRIGAILGEKISVKVVPKTELILQSDVLSVATSIDPGHGPVFDAALRHKSSLHINAVGSDFEGKVEIPKNWLEQAYVSPDFLAQAVREGECQQLEACQIGESLPQLVCTPQLGNAVRDRLTVFDSTGFAFEDFVAVDWVLAQAESRQVGRHFVFGRVGEDPKNPYGGLPKNGEFIPDLQRVGEEVVSLFGATH